MARRLISTKRPDTLTQTFLHSPTFPLQSDGGPYIAATSTELADNRPQFRQVHRVSEFGRLNLVKCMVRRLTAREKLVNEGMSASMYPACFVEMSLLAMMRYAAYLSFETPRPCEGPFEQTGFRCAVL